MPELPEVDVTLKGVLPLLQGQRINRVEIRESRLRWPVPADLPSELSGQTLLDGRRRAKYLLFRFDRGHLMIHLGMSGNLRIVSAATAASKHDHVDIVFSGGRILRYTDPRRFGAVLWLQGEPERHPLLSHLGPEPFDAVFDGSYLYRLSRRRKAPIKQFLMDNRIVVGVGNIYANEALFLSGIRPDRQAGKISRIRYQRLADNVQSVLRRAIAQGGTTLKDFVGSDGKPGYFKQALNVYGRSGQPCVQCGRPLREIRLGQRTTVFCPACQR